MIRTLYPVNQYVGTLESGWLDVIETPSPFDSVSDDSDLTYSGIAADYLSSVRRSALLSCDFVLADPTFNPAFMAMQIRARNGVVDPATLGYWSIYTLYHRADGSDPYAYDAWNQNRAPGSPQLAPLAEGNAYADWFTFYYLGAASATDPTAPDANTWLQIGPDPNALGTVGYTARDALLGGGIRFSIYVNVQSNSIARQHYLDIFEVRMLVADVPLLGVDPPRRLTGRGDDLGIGIGHVYPPPKSHQGGWRRGGGSFY